MSSNCDRLSAGTLFDAAANRNANINANIMQEMKNGNQGSSCLAMIAKQHGFKRDD